MAAEDENSDPVGARTVGIIRTRTWPVVDGPKWYSMHGSQAAKGGSDTLRQPAASSADGHGDDGAVSTYELREGELKRSDGRSATKVLDINLGPDIRSIAQGLFAALRDLDQRGAHVIYVEGIEDTEDIAAAVMNRLRKAASDIRR